MGSTAVLVHNEHSGLLGKIKKSYQTLADEIEKLLPDEAAKLVNYLANKSKQNDFLGYLNTNTAKVKELVDRIKKANIYQTTNELVKDLVENRGKVLSVRYVAEYKVLAQKYYNLNKHLYDSKYINDFEKWYKDVFLNELKQTADFQVHHVIPVNVLEKSKPLQDLMLWASQNGRLADLNFNGIEYGIPVQRRIDANGVDRNGHTNHPQYDIAIRPKIEGIIANANGNNIKALDDVLKFIQATKKTIESDVILGAKNINDIINF